MAEGALAPAYAKRRSTPWQAGHRKVRCSKPGNVVGSAWTASIRTISVLQNKHRIALNHSFIKEVHGARASSIVIKRLATNVHNGWPCLHDKEPAHENFTHLPPLSRSR